MTIARPEERTVCDPGEIGEVWVAGPSVAQGYFGREDETADIFGARLRSGQGPYLRTGDLAFILDGKLHVTGRLKDLIIIRGANYYPQDIEATAEASHPALRPGCSAAFAIEHDDQEALVVVCEVENGREDEAADVVACIRRALVDEHELKARTVALLRTATLPKTPNGKLQRRACRDAYLAGELAIVHESRLEPPVWQHAFADQLLRRLGQNAEEFEEIKRWFLGRLQASGLDVPAWRPDMHLTELGVDSLAIVELKAEIEGEFKIRLHAADLINFPDLGTLADHVLGQIVQARAQASGGGQPQSAPPVLPDQAVENVRHRKSRLRHQRALRAGSAAPDTRLNAPAD